MLIATGPAIETLLEQMWGFRKDKEGKRVKLLCDMVLQGCIDDVISSIQPASIQPVSVQPPLATNSPLRTAITPSTSSYTSLRAAVINGSATLSQQVTIPHLPSLPPSPPHPTLSPLPPLLSHSSCPSLHSLPLSPPSPLNYQ